VAQIKNPYFDTCVLCADMTKNIFEALPLELVFRILDPGSLLPHQQGGFACASHVVLQVSNRNLARLTAPIQSNTLMSVTGQWTAAYRKLSTELRDAVEGTTGVLPCPEIVQGVSHTKSELYIQTWSACQWLRRGEIAEAEQCLELAMDAARETRVRPP
jgi:hypothetical protein